MHHFPKFTPAWNSTCFGQFLCPLSGVYSLYTRQWYMSYRFVNSFRARAGWFHALFWSDIVVNLCFQFFKLCPVVSTITEGLESAPAICRPKSHGFPQSTSDGVKLSLLPFISVSSHSERWDCSFNRNITWRYPSSSTHFTICSQRNRFDWIWWFIVSQWLMSWIHCTLLTFYDWTRQVKVITSVLYGCHLSFKFTREVSINKFEICDLQVHPLNLTNTLR